MLMTWGGPGLTAATSGAGAGAPRVLRPGAGNDVGLRGGCGKKAAAPDDPMAKNGLVLVMCHISIVLRASLNNLE